MNRDTTNDIHTCHAECQRPVCVAVREAVAAEREACCTLLEGMHEAAKHSHNHYLHAALSLRQLRGSDAQEK